MEFANTQVESIHIDEKGTITHSNSGKTGLKGTDITDPTGNKPVSKRPSKRLQRIMIACLIIVILFFSRRLRSMVGRLFMRK